MGKIGKQLGISAVVLTMSFHGKANAAPFQMPPNAPSLAAFQAAAVATFDGAAAQAAGLSLIDVTSGPVTIATTDGVTGAAYTDATGNVIIEFAYATDSASDYLAEATLAGVNPSLLPGYQDALGFVKNVVAGAAILGLPSSKIYLTGFSLGGMLSSYVASQTGLAGVAFGSCGIPGYAANSNTSGNFLSFVEVGDPVGEYGTDSSGAASAALDSPNMDHYGVLVPLGSAEEASELVPFYNLIKGYSLLSVLDGSSPVNADFIDEVEGQENTLQGKYHNMALYTTDSDALAISLGINPNMP